MKIITARGSVLIEMTDTEGSLRVLVPNCMRLERDGSGRYRLVVKDKLEAGNIVLLEEGTVQEVPKEEDIGKVRKWPNSK